MPAFVYFTIGEIKNMGYYKDLMQMHQARGYGDSDKYVCRFCFGDTFLKKTILKQGEQGKCSFCKDAKGKPAKRKVLKLEKLMPYIMAAVDYEYEDSIVALPWDSEEKCYMGNSIDFYDFVTEELNAFMECENEELLDEFLSIINCEDKCSRYEFGQRQHEKDMERWEHYCKLVEESDLSAEQIVSLYEREDAPEYLIEIRDVLENVLEVAEKMYLAETINTGVPIYRCVNYIDWNSTPIGFTTIPATMIGTAPAKLVNDNRMSEKGDMMFYGAFSKEIAMREVGPNGNRPATIGTFHTNKRIRILNLANISNWKCPSVFDVAQRERRSTWFFLREFMLNISQPETKSYKPTQVFNKYIQRKTKLSGIMYRSAKSENRSRNDFGWGDNCVVLYVTNRDCIDEEDVGTEKRVQLIMEAEPVQVRF